MIRRKKRKQSLWTRIRKKIDVAVIVTACICAVAIDIARDAWTGTKAASVIAWNKLATPAEPAKGISDGYFGSGAISDGYFANGTAASIINRLQIGYDFTNTRVENLGGGYDYGSGTGTSPSLPERRGAVVVPSRLT
jgi:hypothetical protein